MKRLIATFITLAVLSMAALPAAAQTRGRSWTTTSNNGRYDSRYDRSANRSGNYRNNVYRNDTYRTNTYDPYYNNSSSYQYGQNGSVWDQHRDKITTAGGVVGGALLGGLIGGKKGALIGAITGGAGAAVYTYKVRDRNRRY
jgi:hypothetical protein